MDAPPPNPADLYPADLYAALHRGNEGDVEFYRRVCEGAEAVLELGCGDGRVLAAIAAPGTDWVGLDLHPGLLELARARPLPDGASIEWVEGDMLDPPTALPKAHFDRVLVPHGGLYCMLEPGALERVLAQAFALLRPGGQLVFDVWAADDFHANHDPSEQAPTWQDHLGRFEIDGRSWEIIERSHWRPEAQRIDVVYTHVPVGAYEAIEGHLPQRYFLQDQIDGALRGAGFSTVEVFGDFAGASYGPDSELLIVRASRR